MRRRLLLAAVGVLAPLGFFVPGMLPAAHAATPGASVCVHIHLDINGTPVDVQVPPGCAN